MAKTCIIGAGIAGLATAKALKDEEIDFDWFERDNTYGGMWHYKSAPHPFSVYQSCRCIFPKNQMTFQDLPCDNALPEYLSQQELWHYMQTYARTFHLDNKLQPNTEIIEVCQQEKNAKRWRVTLRTPQGQETRFYKQVIVATGLYSGRPNQPTFPGHFAGDCMHATAYRTPDAFKNKAVLIVGLGNTAIDIAQDLIPVAKKLYLSCRHTHLFLPKTVLGCPISIFLPAITERFPKKLRYYYLRLLACMGGYGNMQKFSLPSPSLGAPVIFSDTFPGKVRDEQIILKPGINRMEGKEVFFANNTKLAIDTIIYATGYQLSLPFLSQDIINFKEGRVHNYMKIINLDNPGLFFIGFVARTGGGVGRIFEAQAKWLAKLLAGKISLPTEENMRQSIMTYKNKISEFNDHPQNDLLNIRYHEYLKALRHYL